MYKEIIIRLKDLSFTDIDIATMMCGRRSQAAISVDELYDFILDLTQGRKL